MGILALILAGPVLQPINLLNKPKDIGEGREEGRGINETNHLYYFSPCSTPLSLSEQLLILQRCAHRNYCGGTLNTKYLQNHLMSNSETGKSALLL